MVSNGDYPLNNHYDETTLEEYVLGQMLPEEEEAIRQHLISCPQCRTTVAELQWLSKQLKAKLHEQIDSAEPKSPLNFDQIEKEWRKPHPGADLVYHAQRLVPGVPFVVLIGLLLVACLLLIPSSGSAALRSLELTNTYDGPAAIAAVSTEDGLALITLSSDETRVAAHFDYLTNPQNLQFSPDGQWLALQQGRVLHILETRDAGIYISIALHDMSDWSWSPDSTMLAYTDGSGQLALYDVTTQTNRVLVPADEHAWGRPIWTADSQQIAYAVVIPSPSTGEPRLRQGVWRVNRENEYRVELARNPHPDQTLIVPSAWTDNNSALLAWDINGDENQMPLYRVDVDGHQIERVDGYSLADGMRLAWQVNVLDMTLITHQNQLALFDVKDQTQQSLAAEHIISPHSIEWSPNGAWFAYTVSGVAEGDGLFIFTPQESALRQIKLPGGATEKAVFWAGMEHLFVIRQRGNTSELWLVSLTTDAPPQRIFTNAPTPPAGWRWQDIITVRTLN